MKLLSTGSNAKLKKSDGQEYINYGLSIAPSDLNENGVELCPGKSAGCYKSCLNTAGRGAMNMVQEARLRKANYLLSNTADFIETLSKEVISACKSAKRKGKTPVFRLNVISDIAYELGQDKLRNKDGTYTTLNLRNAEGYTIPELIRQHGGICYDYTKRPVRAIAALDTPEIDITFSRSESNDNTVRRLLDKGIRVAAVFSGSLPQIYKGVRVIDGDTTDLRFLDPGACIVGLLAKGKARKDSSGFVIDNTNPPKPETKSTVIIKDCKKVLKNS